MGTTHRDARRTRRLLTLLGALTLAASPALTACSEDATPGDPQRPAASSTPTDGASAPSAAPTDPLATDASGSASPGAAGSVGATDYLPVPVGVSLTPQGTSLRVGQRATVAYRPDQRSVGALAITITRLQSTTIRQSFSGWQIPDEARTSAPYFVRARVTNVGSSDLGGRPVPLYALDADDTLVEASRLLGRFTPCSGSVLPSRFAPGASTSVCLIYFVPRKGELAGVSFRPVQDFAPITWTGAVTPLRPATRR